MPFRDPAEAPKTAAADNPSTLTLNLWRATLRARLAPLSETPGSDARALIAHTLQKPQSWLLAHPEYHLSPSETHNLTQALDSLMNGVPLPYVLGRWEFFGLSFDLSPEVLIPRPETELLVETALAWLTAFPERRRAIDLGTGSGCIAVSLASHIPDLNLLAVDLSPEALVTARHNARLHQVADRIQFRQGDLWGPAEGSYDLVCANLPYIPTATLPSLAIFGREPTLALDGGGDGLDLIRRLLAEAPNYLPAEGLLLAEIEGSQGPEVLMLASKYFPDGQVRLLSDLAGHDRLLSVQQRSLSAFQR